MKNFEEKIPCLVAALHAQWFSPVSVIRNSRITAASLAVMNLALRGSDADFDPEQADTFRRDLHPDLRADGGGQNLSRGANPRTTFVR